MDETKIKEQLKIQREYIDKAKRMADEGYAQQTAEYLAQARRCQDGISLILLGVENEGLVVQLTPALMQRGMEMVDNPYAQETIRVFHEGLEYCTGKLEEAESRRMMN